MGLVGVWIRVENSAITLGIKLADSVSDNISYVIY